MNTIIKRITKVYLKAILHNSNSMGVVIGELMESRDKPDLNEVQRLNFLHKINSVQDFQSRVNSAVKDVCVALDISLEGVSDE